MCSFFFSFSYILALSCGIGSVILSAFTLTGGAACIFSCTEPEGSEDTGSRVLVVFQCYILDHGLAILPLTPMVLWGLTSSLSQAHVQGEPPGQESPDPSLKCSFSVASWNIGISLGVGFLENGKMHRHFCSKISLSSERSLKSNC